MSYPAKSEIIEITVEHFPDAPNYIAPLKLIEELEGQGFSLHKSLDYQQSRSNLTLETIFVVLLDELKRTKESLVKLETKLWNTRDSYNERITLGSAIKSIFTKDNQSITDEGEANSDVNHYRHQITTFLNCLIILLKEIKEAAITLNLEQDKKERILNDVMKCCSLLGKENEASMKIIDQILDHFINSNCKSIIEFVNEGINNEDENRNTPLYYAKLLDYSKIIFTLLDKGAKVRRNKFGKPNVTPEMLENYLTERCMIPNNNKHDQDYTIIMKFHLFKVNRKFIKNFIKDENRSDDEFDDTYNFIDYECLTIFSEDEAFSKVIEHPVITTLLEIEHNCLLSFKYMMEFLLYLSLVSSLFIHYSFRFSVLKGNQFIRTNELTKIFVSIFVFFQMNLEFKQIFRLKKKYFKILSNYVDWFVIVMALGTTPEPEFFILSIEVSRHLSAVTLLFAFIRLVFIFIRMMPYTSIPAFIYMYTTVALSYVTIILTYLPFLFGFSYSFLLTFGNRNSTDEELTNTNIKNNGDLMIQNDTFLLICRGDDEKNFFTDIGQSFMKTSVMFIGELDYSSLNFNNWLGYIKFFIFIFLIVIVLMNVLNGLAVSDISKIRDQADISTIMIIIESLLEDYPRLMYEEVKIYPNKDQEGTIISMLQRYVTNCRRFIIESNQTNYKKEKSYELIEIYLWLLEFFHVHKLSISEPNVKSALKVMYEKDDKKIEDKNSSLDEKLLEMENKLESKMQTKLEISEDKLMDTLRTILDSMDKLNEKISCQKNLIEDI